MGTFTMVGALAFAGAAALGGGNSESTRDVLAAEDARFAAMVAGDTTALASMLAADLTYVHSSGRVETKDEHLKAIGSRAIRYLAFLPTERRVTLMSTGAAIVMGRANARVVLAGQEQTLDVRYIAVYGHAAGSWLLRAWQTTRIPTLTGG